MAYREKKQTQSPEENKKARPEEQFVPEQHSFGMPNSLLQAVPMTPPSGTPNSLMREMDAEVRGALFGGRGFDPTVGAHELSHTVRREPVPGPVSLSVPDGTIQRSSQANGWEKNLRDGNDGGSILPAAAAAAPPVYEQLNAAADEKFRKNIHRNVSHYLEEIVVLQRAVRTPNFQWALNYHGKMTNEEKNPRKKAIKAKRTEKIAGLPEELDKLNTFFIEVLRKVQDPQQHPLSIIDSMKMGEPSPEKRLDNCKRLIEDLELLEYVREDDMVTVENKEDEADQQPPTYDQVTPGASDEPAAAAAAAAVSDAPPAYGDQDTPGASEDDEDFVMVDENSEPEAEQEGWFRRLFHRKKKK